MLSENSHRLSSPPRSAVHLDQLPLEKPPNATATIRMTCCTFGVVGGYVGAVVGKKIDKTLQLSVAMAAGSFLLASLLREEIARWLFALVNFLLRWKSSNALKVRDGSVPNLSLPASPVALQEESWWPTLNTLGQTEASHRSSATSTTNDARMHPSRLNSSRITNKNVDIVVKDVDPALPVRKKKKRNIAFWRKDETEQVQESKPCLPPWSQVHIDRKNYVEDYGT